jgi:hypothetical protein
MKPCEHQICEECFTSIRGQKKCPICRTNVSSLVNRTNQQQVWPNETQPPPQPHTYMRENQPHEMPRMSTVWNPESPYASLIGQIIRYYEFSIDYFENLRRQTIINPDIYHSFDQYIERTYQNSPAHILAYNQFLRIFNNMNEAIVDKMYRNYRGLPEADVSTPNSLVERFNNWQREQDEPVMPIVNNRPPLRPDYSLKKKLLAYVMSIEITYQANYRDRINRLFTMNDITYDILRGLEQDTPYQP